MLELLDEIVTRARLGEALAVCTVVGTRGSTPQKTGAVMLVLRDGQTRGTIGGGCVEAEVRTRTLERLQRHGHGVLFHFKLDHDLGWDDGLVCGGTMDVAVEIVDGPERAEHYARARETLAGGQEASIRVTVPDASEQPVDFHRILEPKPALLIAGAGHVGAALAPIGVELGFRVTVIDDRSDLASAERFAGATRVVGEIETELTRCPITNHTYVVIVTRGHRHDGRALRAVIGSTARYIGLIGSNRKIITILQELFRQGVPRDALERVHAPIGLNIGAVTPAEIAVSIAAELVAVRRAASDRPVKPMRVTSALLARSLRRG